MSERDFHIRHYVAAVLAVVVTMVLKTGTEVLLGPDPPFLVYLPAVTFSAWLGGLGPGLWALALSALVGVVWHTPPYHSLVLASPHDRINLSVFLGEGALLSILMGQLRAARKAAEASEREAKEYHEEMTRSEGRLRAVLDNSPSMIFLRDLSGRYLLVNREFERVMNAPSEALLNQDDSGLFNSGTAARFRATDRLVLLRGAPVELEDVLPSSRGPRTYLSVRFPLRDPSSAIYAVGGILTDITERKRMVSELEASERRFRTLSESSPMGIFLTDQVGRTTYTNPRCQEIFGFGPDEGLDVGWSRFIHPDDQATVIGEWTRLAPIGGVFSMEYRAVRPDGMVRWVYDRTAPLLSDAGELIGHVGTVEDITDRRHAEESVRRDRDFAEGLIATAQAIVLVLDASGRIVRANPFWERLTGRGVEEARGENWFMAFVPARERPRAKALFTGALARVPPERTMHSVLGRDGRPLRIEWAYRAIEGPEGESWALAIGHDITALVEAQGRALHAERLAAIGEMVAGLTHESRNALHRSQVCLEMLALEVEDRPEAISLIGRIQVALDDLFRLFDDVRTYASPIVLEPRVCDVAEVWREAWTRLETSRRPGDALIEEIDAAAGPATAFALNGAALEGCRCVADPFRLGQVFRNVFDNAIEAEAEAAASSRAERNGTAGGGIDHQKPIPETGAATNVGAVIVVRCGPADLDGRPALRIAVRDHGPGLSPEQRQRLFEPFFTTKTKGTGLGMAITKRIIDAHGGRITVDDRAPGAEIIITLPRGGL